MEYRNTTATEHGFDNADEEFEAMRSYITHMMGHSGPCDLLDSILIIVNICEQRALLYGHHPVLHTWYTTTALVLRQALELLTVNKDGFCPQDKFENPLLYFPDVERQH